jgi:DNA-directed RNA polymerase subunit N (RpoN/RPB10)
LAESGLTGASRAKQVSAFRAPQLRPHKIRVPLNEIECHFHLYSRRPVFCGFRAPYPVSICCDYERKSQRDHIHTACLHCGKISEFVSDLFERLKEQVEKDCNFSVMVSRLEIGGYCSTCRALRR